MRTFAREAASQPSLRINPPRSGVEVRLYVILVKGVHETVHFGRRLLLVTRSRCHCSWFWYFSTYEKIQEIGLLKSSPESIYLRLVPPVFPRELSASFLLSTSDSFRVSKLKVSDCRASDFILVEADKCPFFIHRCQDFFLLIYSEVIKMLSTLGS